MVTEKEPKFVLALDFGGTKLSAAIVNIENGEIAALIQKSTPVQQGAAGTLEVMVATAKEVLGKFGRRDHVTQTGISFGGPVNQDRTAVLHSHHVADWDGIVLTEIMQDTFGMPAFMDNDANAAALGEWYFGAGKRAQNMLYIQVSTGIGAGLILDSHLYRGAALAGEFGHIIILPDGPACVCGRKGCVESLCAGWAIARDGKEALKNASWTYKDSPRRK